MEAVLLGTAGFLLYFLYDVNSIVMKNGFVQKFFALGSVLEVISVIWAMKLFGRQRAFCPVIVLLFAIGAAGFFLLLIYTLFFALPFEETYCKENTVRLAYTEGVYSLCRHPGVLWFAGAYLCLWGITGSVSGGGYFLSMIAWNFIYVILQDMWTFPHTFSNYLEYKKKTPFLFPNRKSIQECLSHYTKDKR